MVKASLPKSSATCPTQSLGAFLLAEDERSGKKIGYTWASSCLLSKSTENDETRLLTEGHFLVVRWLGLTKKKTTAFALLTHMR